MTGVRSHAARLPRLLIVDDDPNVCRSIGEALEAVAEVDTCQNARSAVFRIERHSYDVVIAGYTLAGSAGTTLLGAVGKREPEMLGLLLTSSGEYEQGERTSGHRILPKTVEPERLCSTVKQLLSIVRMRRAVRAIRQGTQGLTTGTSTNPAR